MIRLGLRLAVSGGREAVVRLVIVAAAVGIGVGLLLTVVSAVNAVGVQNDRYAWLDTGTPAAAAAAGSGGATTATSRDPLWALITTDLFDGQAIFRADVAATGPASPVPPGSPATPGRASTTSPPRSARCCAVPRRASWRTATPGSRRA